MTTEIDNDIWKFKIILAGAGAVGKTTLMNRFVRGSFASEYKATIGVDILTKEITYNDQNKNQLIKLQIWDIAGQELFRSFRKRFFSNARGVLLVFDLTVIQTLSELSSWVSDIYEIAGKIPIVLIGNKVDLQELCVISSESIESFQTAHNITSYYPTSALTGKNVDNAFHTLIKLIAPIDS
jgi:small GTP-binding protein